MRETIESLNIGAERLIIRGKPGTHRGGCWHGIIYANVWCESDDGRWAWNARRVSVVTIASYPTEREAAEAMKRIAWGIG